MKRIVLIISISFIAQIALLAQPKFQIEGEVVYKGDEIIFHKIDEHTWVGTGHEMFNESLYLVEGESKAVLIDAGTKIKDLNKIASSITTKPVMLVATHVHPDHVGAIDSFSEIYINPADTINIPLFMPDYKGKVKYLKDGQILDLGGRQLEVIFTPGHTPGSTTFIDKEAGYGFSGDSFGSGNLLLLTDFSTLQSTCEQMSKVMTEQDINKLYPGHYMGPNVETKQRLDDLAKISKGALSGEIVGEENPQGMLGLNLVIGMYGVRVNYNENALK